MPMKLVIGNKAYSSWSLRPWIAMRQLDIPFEEIVLPLDTPEFRPGILSYSPAGRVPVLVDGAITVWDSLAILEYLAEWHPSLWPAENATRARARSISAEMHSGFQALRRDFSMNVRRSLPGRMPGAEAAADIARVCAIWREARQNFGGGGPFLFGAFTAADAMYAPVATRFRTYGLAADDAVAQDYVAAIMSLPAMRRWVAEAEAESWVLEKYETA
jgi:glutathione S-transferase